MAFLLLHNYTDFIKRRVSIMKKKIIIGAIVSSILGLGILGVNSVKQEPVKVAT